MTVKLLTLATLAYLSLAARYQPEFQPRPKPSNPQHVADEAIRASGRHYLAAQNTDLPAPETEAFLQKCEHTARELAHGELIEDYFHDVIRQRLAERGSTDECWIHICNL